MPKDRTVTLQKQYRKCGKPACGTCRKTVGHGPYWYAYWREEKKLISFYIGKVNPRHPDTPIYIENIAHTLCLTEEGEATLEVAMPVLALA